MAEKDTVFSSKMKYGGIFNFKDFYKFCYDWLTEEMGFHVSEAEYEEKIGGNTKDMLIKWEGQRELTDYFRFDVKVEFRITNLSKVELNRDGKKIKTNEGSATVKVKGVLVRDYKGKFEVSASKKFMRSVYEKWIIPSRVEEFQGKIAGDCDEFLSQAKAFLDLEGKR